VLSDKFPLIVFTLSILCFALILHTKDYSGGTYNLSDFENKTGKIGRK
jgi:hypothetical protein